jgi:hypothetical protein
VAASGLWAEVHALVANVGLSAVVSSSPEHSIEHLASIRGSISETSRDGIQGVDVEAKVMVVTADEEGNVGAAVAIVALPGHTIEQLVGVTERRSSTCVAVAATGSESK